MSNKQVVVEIIRADMPLNELLRYMAQRNLAHVQIPHKEGLSVHIALLFDPESSSKLVAHLDQVTQESQLTASRETP